MLSFCNRVGSLRLSFQLLIVKSLAPCSRAEALFPSWRARLVAFNLKASSYTFHRVLSMMRVCPPHAKWLIKVALSTSFFLASPFLSISLLQFLLEPQPSIECRVESVGKSRGFYSRKYSMCFLATVVMLCIQNQNCESSMFENLFTHKEPKWATWQSQQFACFFLVAGPVHAWPTVPWVFQWCPRCLSLVSLLVSGACGKRLGWEPSHARLKHKPVLNPNPLLPDASTLVWLQLWRGWSWRSVWGGWFRLRWRYVRSEAPSWKHSRE